MPRGISRRSFRLQGVVILEITIDETGRVATATVARPASPSSRMLLEQAALATVRQWEYAPTVVEGSLFR